MEDKYKVIYEQLKEETKNTLENKNSDKFIDEFTAAVKERMKEIHEKLDKKREELIALTLEAYNKEICSVENPEEIEIRKKVLKNKKKKVEDEVDPNSFKGKINSLIENLEGVMEKSKSLEETVNIFKSSNLNKLIDFKDGDFYFTHERKLKYMLMGKINWDLGWSKSMNKPVNSNIDLNDSSKLNVTSNSCYNYLTTDKEITDENVLVVLETDITKTDSYFYFGLANELLSRDGSCMCGSPANCTYIKSTGYVVCNSANNPNSNVKFDNDGVKTIEIRVLGKDKEVYFKVNDFDEQGPFALNGSRWTITSGSCNSANGYIKIISSIIVG
jgi:hypothetical protein